MPIAYNIKNIAKEVMEELEKKQLVFFIESHFQYEFAMKLADLYNKNVKKLSLEYKPYSGKNGGQYKIDLYVEMIGGGRLMFEFKYITEEQTIPIMISSGAVIDYNLKNQLGHTQRKEEFWGDIAKLEQMKVNKECDEAVAILLTNSCKFLKSHSKDKRINLFTNDSNAGVLFDGGGFSFPPNSRQSGFKVNHNYQEEIVPYNVQGIKFKYFIVEIK